MEETVEDASAIPLLSKVIKGSVAIMLGSVISLILSFLTKTIIARFYDVSEYGLYAVSFTVVNIASTIALMGIHAYLPRIISYEKERDTIYVGRAVTASLATVFLSSILISAVVYSYSDVLSQALRSPGATRSLRILALALPPMTMMNILVSIARGYGRARETLLYFYLLYYFLFFAMALVMGVLGFPIIYIFYAFVLSQAVSFLLFSLDLWSKRLLRLVVPEDWRVVAGILRYSIPLLISSVAGLVLTWSDTLMISYFLGERMVGFYRAATPFAKLLPFPLSALAYMYLPVATEAYSRGDREGLRRLYQVLARWSFVAVLPVFTLFFVFPGATIGFVFGSKYYYASQSLRFLSLGFFIQAVLGLSRHSLITIRDTGFVFYSTSSSAIVNVALNYLLIPRYGIAGAAVATSSSLALLVVLETIRFYLKTGIHPFTKSFLKPLIISIGLIIVLIASNVSVYSLTRAVIVLFMFLAAYSSLVLVSKSIDLEDIVILEKISRKMGLDLGGLIVFLKRFVSKKLPDERRH